MTAAYVLAGEPETGGQHVEAFNRYETLLRAFINSKQKGAERFSGAFAPRTAFWTVRTQFRDQGLHRSGTGKTRVEPRHYG